MATTGPSKRALNEARKLAREAAKDDNWMEPVPEEHDEEDYGDFVEAHRGQWEQTCHFDHFYREKLIALADAQAARFNVFQAEDWEAWYYGFVIPIKEAFWEEWEEKVNLLEKWEAHHKGEG